MRVRTLFFASPPAAECKGVSHGENKEEHNIEEQQYCILPDEWYSKFQIYVRRTVELV